MTYKIKTYKYLCGLEEFEINGIKADYVDFGTKEDRDCKSAEPYSCGDMQFIPYQEPKVDVLEKYHINEDEWIVIAHKLRGALSFGRCGWCR